MVDNIKKYIRDERERRQGALFLTSDFDKEADLEEFFKQEIEVWTVKFMELGMTQENVVKALEKILLVFKRAELGEQELIVFDEDTKSLKNVISTCINGNAIQLNVERWEEQK